MKRRERERGFAYLHTYKHSLQWHTSSTTTTFKNLLWGAKMKEKIFISMCDHAKDIISLYG